MSSNGPLPSNFSFVSPDRLAGMARPQSSEHIHSLHKAGIRLIVSLTPTKLAGIELPAGLEIEVLHLPVSDFCPPTPAQLEEFLQVEVVHHNKRKGALAVHCTAGQGRTGTILACWLACHHRLTADHAISMIRDLRPGSIETLSQIEFIQEFCKFLAESPSYLSEVEST